ncbi:hypothetical protein AAVH_12460, partial [Aphelenchoides avenae]
MGVLVKLFLITVLVQLLTPLSWAQPGEIKGQPWRLQARRFERLCNREPDRPICQNLFGSRRANERDVVQQDPEADPYNSPYDA